METSVVTPVCSLSFRATRVALRLSRPLDVGQA